MFLLSRNLVTSARVFVTYTAPEVSKDLEPHIHSKRHAIYDHKLSPIKSSVSLATLMALAILSQILHEKYSKRPEETENSLSCSKESHMALKKLVTVTMKQ